MIEGSWSWVSSRESSSRPPQRCGTCKSFRYASVGMLNAEVIGVCENEKRSTYGMVLSEGRTGKIIEPCWSSRRVEAMEEVGADD